MISFELSCLLNGVFWLKAFFECFCVDRWRVLSVGELRRDTLMLFNSKIPTRLDFSFLSQTQSFFFSTFFSLNFIYCSTDVVNDDQRWSRLSFFNSSSVIVFLPNRSQRPLRVRRISIE